PVRPRSHEYRVPPSQAHDLNDKVLERIYIGRRFKNDTERLEKLFELNTKMTIWQPSVKKSPKRSKGVKS
ncbi:MAG: hypothetical protein WCA35_14385, partial [Kovacikia sp.]